MFKRRLPIGIRAGGGGARGAAVPQLRKLRNVSGKTLMIRATTLGEKTLQNNAVDVISKTRKTKVPTSYVSLCY